MMALGIFGMVVAGGYGVYATCHRVWFQASAATIAGMDANIVVQKLVYGEGGTNGLRSACKTNVVLTAGPGEWSIRYTTFDGAGYCYRYVASGRRIEYADLSVDSNLYHVLSSSVITSSIAPSSDGVTVMVASVATEGRFTVTNATSTFVRYRN